VAAIQPDARLVGATARRDRLGAEIGDFADTAAILTHVDFVISVDTSMFTWRGQWASRCAADSP
jgi:hypothetical protein